jgi:hypothetical protein
MIDAQSHATAAQASPGVVFEQMIQAANRHDLDAMVAYFSPDYRSEQPIHPERAFIGQAGVRKNWSYFFSTAPNMQVEIVSMVEDSDSLRAELEFRGTQTNRTEFHLSGVMVLGVHAGLITWGRVYIEPVQGPH